ncbi:hypothetical protein KJ865_16095, partial [Myxococcota bacterium]|nr:hypothetical protein [Myxococcota bacterium]
LGSGTALNESGDPIAIANLPTGVQDISAGKWHVCVLTQAGQIYCWGEGGKGQLGNGATTDMNNPMLVNAPGTVFTSLSCGWELTCAVTAGATVMCWGSNNVSQVGDHTTVNQTSPVFVQEMDNAVLVSAQRERACSVRADGTVWCWGAGDFGGLGDGYRADSMSPVQVKNARGLVSIGNISRYFSCGLNAMGNIFCWGRNDNGQLGYDCQNADLKGAARILDPFRRANCHDGIDNDGDGFIDTVDTDCIPYEQSVYQFFNPAIPFDLAHKKLRFTLQSATQSYSYTVLDATAFDVVPGTGMSSRQFNLMDDDMWPIVSIGFDFPFFQKVHSSLFIGSDGKISFEEGSLDWSESPIEFLNGPPMIAAIWNDWYHDDMSTADDIYFDQFADHVAITFVGIRDVEDAHFVNFQVVLWDTGEIEISYGDTDNTDGLVGVTPGRGATDTSSVDFLP